SELQSTRDRSFLSGTYFFSFFCLQEDFLQIMRLNDLERVVSFPEDIVSENRYLAQTIFKTGKRKWKYLVTPERIYSNSVANNNVAKDSNFLMAIHSKDRVYFALLRIR
ncbi:MAG: hypothetical protein AAF404_10065, partial [Pseudomonadota bacterium]